MSETSGASRTPETFMGSPNTIFLISTNPPVPVSYTVSIVQYPDIISVLTAGRTTLFKIANTAVATTPTNPVNVVGNSNVNISTTVPNGFIVPVGTTR